MIFYAILVRLYCIKLRKAPKIPKNSNFVKMTVSFHLRFEQFLVTNGNESDFSEILLLIIIHLKHFWFFVVEILNTHLPTPVAWNVLKVIDIERRLRSPAILFSHHGEKFGGKPAIFWNSRKEWGRPRARTVPCLSISGPISFFD